MKVWYFTPYDLSKNLGLAYNQYMRLIPDEDTACFTDGDCCFLTPNFGTIIQQYAEAYPDAVLTCYTNRIHPLSKQLDQGQMDEQCNIRELISKAESMKHLTSVTEILPGEGLSGMLLVVPKKVWMVIPFIENEGCLGVDTDFRIRLHQKGIKIFIMDCLLVFHIYRLLTNSKKHLV